MADIDLIILLFFAVAVVYSAIGFGGGSSYIAILLLFGLGVEEVRMTALICNIIVVTGSTINYYRHGLLNWKKVVPLLILSIPFAFIGGSIKPHHNTYITIAGIALIIAAIVMLFQTRLKPIKRSFNKGSLLGIGGGIGLLSGFIGIGGGIFLSPLLHLAKWETAIKISATASLFILVNSLAGLVGQITTGANINVHHILMLGGAVLFGGQIGNRLNIRFLKPSTITITTAILVGLIGVKLLRDSML